MARRAVGLVLEICAALLASSVADSDPDAITEMGDQHHPEVAPTRLSCSECALENISTLGICGWGKVEKKGNWCLYQGEHVCCAADPAECCTMDRAEYTAAAIGLIALLSLALCAVCVMFVSVAVYRDSPPPSTPHETL